VLVQETIGDGLIQFAQRKWEDAHPADEEYMEVIVLSFCRRVGAPKSRIKLSLLALIVVGTISVIVWSSASTAQLAATNGDEATLLEGFRHVEVASVSDALEQITGKKMYMSHGMRPIFPAKFAGIALTVHLKKEENNDPKALEGMLSAIDQGGKDSVYVMAVDDGIDIAGMGGLMGTAMSARSYAGAVVDAGVRDVAHLKKIGFPVYAMGIVPSTSVHHYRFSGSNVPVVCAGVEVRPGDVVVADGDGVVVVPREAAAKALTLAQDLDIKEHSMYAIIEKTKSIVEAVKQIGRL
jgi:regulator of RNase E activity RraA